MVAGCARCQRLIIRYLYLFFLHIDIVSVRQISWMLHASNERTLGTTARRCRIARLASRHWLHILLRVTSDHHLSLRSVADMQLE